MAHQKLEKGYVINNYTVVQQKGKGRYGVVYHCIHNQTKQPVAIKKSGLNMKVEGVSPIALRQISALYSLKSEHIVNLITTFMGDNCIFLVFQLLDTDLEEFLGKLKEYQTLSPPKIKHFMFQILTAIELCHSKRVIHRDVKPANILLTKKGQIKLGDFGLSRTFSYPIQPLSEEVVTLWYRAPQILLRHKFYGPPVDVWAVGCIFGQMIFKRKMFKGQNQMDQLNKIFEVMGSPKVEHWPQILQNNYFELVNTKYSNDIFRQGVQNCHIQESGKDLLCKLLQLNPNKRITAEAALRHPYFSEMNK